MRIGNSFQTKNQAWNELKTGLDNHLRKNSIEKIEKKTVKINVKLPHVNKKPLARNGNSVQTKNQAQNELRMEWDTHLGKKPIQKIEKKVKIKVKLLHVNKKPLARNGNSAQTKNQAWIELRMDWDNHLGKKMRSKK